MKTKIDIISGFLGSGKTTLIKKLMDNEFKDEKIAIIENEFGEISIDGAILEAKNVDIKEINSGCICCSLVGDFKEAIKEIVDNYNPDRIIIEPSGVAKLSDVIKACRGIDNDLGDNINMVITVVDAWKAKMYLKNFGEFYKDQIRNGKIIVLTRTQRLESDRLEEIINSIKFINSEATIIKESIDEINFNNIEYIKEKKSAETFKLVHRLNLKSYPKARREKKHSADNIFSSWGGESLKIFTEKELESIFEKIEDKDEYGIILRAKGIVKGKNEKWIEFHYVPMELNMSLAKVQSSSKVCVIGKGINKDKLQSLFL
ncbi:CobW family GTP-binding protein [Clostridium vincentii]|uniref:Putative GTP-binding protein YjiA n=1 Tax=Clostridium vincentii TaxID=52704 RepID=A0A2T0BFG1_9CLOT|nr:GTP-binding protein [Clostridium vincentii]PRR82630.1 putative GTP-binding protein YjiA [Clostridium vincentii]